MKVVGTWRSRRKIYALWESTAFVCGSGSVIANSCVNITIKSTKSRCCGLRTENCYRSRLNWKKAASTQIFCVQKPAMFWMTHELCKQHQVGWMSIRGRLLSCLTINTVKPVKPSWTLSRHSPVSSSCSFPWSFTRLSVQLASSRALDRQADPPAQVKAAVQ